MRTRPVRSDLTIRLVSCPDKVTVNGLLITRTFTVCNRINPDLTRSQKGQWRCTVKVADDGGGDSVITQENLDNRIPVFASLTCTCGTNDDARLHTHSLIALSLRWSAPVLS